MLLVKIHYVLEIYSVFQDIIVKNIYSIGVSSHLIYSDSFAGRVNCFLGPNPLVCFSADQPLYRSIIILSIFNKTLLHCLIAMSNASSWSASHLATGHIKIQGGYREVIWHLFRLPRAFWWFKIAGKKVSDGSIAEKQLILRGK